MKPNQSKPMLNMTLKQLEQLLSPVSSSTSSDAKDQPHSEAFAASQRLTR